MISRCWFTKMHTHIALEGNVHANHTAMVTNIYKLISQTNKVSEFSHSVFSIP